MRKRIGAWILCGALAAALVWGFFGLGRASSGEESALRQGLIYLYLGFPREAAALLAQAREAGPPEPELGLAFSLSLEALGRPDEAAAALEALAASFPAEAQNERAALQALEAIFLEAAGDRKRAEEKYRQALESSPRLAVAHRRLALVLWARGEKEEALWHLRRSVEESPEYLAAWLERGRLSRSLDRREESKASYEAVLRLDPGNEEAKAALKELAGS
ncbi:MAG: tetratricopeptide repeat protein [Bacillota bacterium]|nr:tetratricopeptide repeat protein [Bacillota bacterium]